MDRHEEKNEPWHRTLQRRRCTLREHSIRLEQGRQQTATDHHSPWWCNHNRSALRWSGWYVGRSSRILSIASRENDSSDNDISETYRMYFAMPTVERQTSRENSVCRPSESLPSGWLDHDGWAVRLRLGNPGRTECSENSFLRYRSLVDSQSSILPVGSEHERRASPLVKVARCFQSESTEI